MTQIKDIVTMVNDRMGDFTEQGSARADVEQARVVYPLPDRYIIPESLIGIVTRQDDTTYELVNTDYLIDNRGAYLRLLAPDPSWVTLDMFYSFKEWPDALVLQLINAALASLFPQFYVSTTETLSASPSEQSYSPAADVELVSSIAIKSGTTWVPNDRWRWDDGSHTIEFNTSPGSGDMRLQVIKRPPQFSATTQDLTSDLKLPEGAVEPIVLYCMHGLFTQGLMRRSRGDGGVDTQGSGSVAPDPLLRIKNIIWQDYLMAKQTNAMLPWSGSYEVSY